MLKSISNDIILYDRRLCCAGPWNIFKVLLTEVAATTHQLRMQRKQARCQSSAPASWTHFYSQSTPSFDNCERWNIVGTLDTSAIGKGLRVLFMCPQPDACTILQYTIVKLSGRTILELILSILESNWRWQIQRLGGKVLYRCLNQHLGLAVMIQREHLWQQETFDHGSLFAHKAATRKLLDFCNHVQNKKDSGNLIICIPSCSRMSGPRGYW